MGQMVYLKDVVSLSFQSEKCTGCGTCLLVCPHAVFVRRNGKVGIQDRDACMECGACAKNCPAEAITVQSGVGCAAAVINSALGRKNASCCCVAPSNEQRSEAAREEKKVSCC
jgi:NAD-dependent dihydropyrimidine dehydrogenase PreA subunit